MRLRTLRTLASSRAVPATEANTETRLKTIPGVEGSSVASSVPVLSGMGRMFEFEGGPATLVGEQRAQFLSVGSNYFQVLGAVVMAGRDFDDGDRMTALAVVVVNQSFAAAFWPEPLG